MLPLWGSCRGATEGDFPNRKDLPMAAQAGKDILLKISDGAPTPVFTGVSLQSACLQLCIVRA
jgi:hypothetical protein